jgi:hypothetical protein
LGTGHTPVPIDQYLAEQRQKGLANQSHRASARGLLELFELLGFTDESGGAFALTPEGKAIASIAGKPLDGPGIAVWRKAINSFQHTDEDGTSHPYQVLLRLVARRPGISRAKCALALEAADDSEDELERIVKLSDLDEDEIKDKIGVSNSNWNNAKKILPRFAEQLGDVIKKQRKLVLAEAPGAGATVARDPDREKSQVAPPRTARKVTPDTIAKAGLSERDEAPPPPDLDPQAMAAAIAARAARLKRHNEIVRALAKVFGDEGAEIFEDPFDLLAKFEEDGILVEVKTLDGSEGDERDRVRGAAAQVLYYEAFVTTPITGDASLQKIACFEHKPSNAHCKWLRSLGIGVLWKTDDGFAGDRIGKAVIA